MNIDKKLERYVEQNIFSQYKLNDKAHQIDHIKYVIKRCFKFSKNMNVDDNMLYVIAAYHDIGHHIDYKNHEKVSAEILYTDKNLREFFSEKDLRIMKEAIEDHRASLTKDPRNIYGKILASADKNVDVNIFLERTLAFGLEHYKELSIPQQIDRAYEHASDKYGKNGYAVDKFYVKDDKYSIYLNELQNLIENKSEFYKKAENILKQMIDK